MVTALRLALEFLQLCKRRLAIHSANVEGKSLVRHHLLEEESNGIAWFKTARRKHAGGLCFQIRVDAGSNDFVFHGYIVATFFCVLKGVYA